MQPIDLLIQAQWVIPIEPEGVCLSHHAVAVDKGRILDVLPRDEAARRYAAAEAVDLPDHVVLPGFVNAHCHAAMTLLRGIADDLPLMRWLKEAIWPLETRHVAHAFVRDGTLLAAHEMLLGGITTCNDMYFFPEAAAEAFDMAGMRAALGMVVIDFPTAYASDVDDYFRKNLAVRDAWQGHPRLSFTLAPHAPYTVSDPTLLRAASLAAELDLPFHIHVHETIDEIRDGVTATGRRPLDRLAALELLGPNFLAVHAVHLEPGEIRALADYGCSVAHCPTSNMKLASGIAPVPALLAAGVNVALGTDGAASNNRLDLFHEMRHAGLLAKVSTLDASALPAHQLLRMATLNGARALGMDNHIGSLLPGKAADLVAVSLAAPELRPCFDPAAHVIHVAGREHVSHVWVDGVAQVAAGRMLRACNSDLFRIASLWQNKFGID